MQRYRWGLAAALLLVGCGVGVAQQIQFRPLPAQEAPITVRYLFQDDVGFLWMGTDDGLVKYDGYTFRTYRSDVRDSTALSYNVVRALAQDTTGRLWVGTSEAGLNAFDRKTEQFRQYRWDEDVRNGLLTDKILSLLPDAQGGLWVGTSRGLNRWDAATNRFEAYTLGPPRDRSYSVHALAQGPDGVLWVGTTHGLYRLPVSTGKAVPVALNVQAGPAVYALQADPSGTLWIGTRNGLVRYKPATGAARLFTTAGGDLPHNRIRVLYQAGPGPIWIGTDCGLARLSPADETFTSYLHDADPDDRSGCKRVRSILQDRSGMLWVGTYGSGVFLQRRLVFDTFGTETGLPDPVVLSILEDRSGKVWVGTFSAGLHHLDTANRTLRAYPHRPGDATSLGHNMVLALLEDRQGTLWVGTAAGLHRWEAATQTFTRFTHQAEDPATLSHNVVLSLYEDRAGFLWVGTLEGGLNRMDPATGRFQRYKKEADAPPSRAPADNTVNAIVEDETGALWVGTLGGLSKHNPQTGAFAHYTAAAGGLRSNDIVALHLDGAGMLWVATSDAGFCRMDPRTEAIRWYTTEDGLPDYKVWGIMEDAQGALWLNNASVITRFDPKRETFSAYGAADGLGGGGFNERANHRGRQTDALYFGSTDGLIRVVPGHERNYHVPPVVVTGFYIFDEEVESEVLDGETVVLQPDQNVFSFEFAALDFTQPEQNRYRYMLEGFDDAWRPTRQREAKYTNLDAGTYVFHAQGSNNDHLWNETGSRITVIVVPPWYQTWWFKTGLAGIGLLAALFWMAARKRQRRQVQDVREAERGSIALALHDGPLQALISTRFVTRTLGQTAEHPAQRRQVDQLDEMLKNVRFGLRTVVEELEPNLADGLDEAIRSHVSLINPLHPEVNIVLELDRDDGILQRHIRQDLFRIYRTALLNVFRHAQATQVRIRLNVQRKSAMLEVTDNGQGFSVPAVLPKGHGLYYADRLAQALQGKLEIESRPQQGTTLRVRLKLRKRFLFESNGS